ncbi:DUF4212 domain-containing protein [Halorubrum sp. JWXQ-INN 858]|uniref:DUF4212 domain-containing protein n=1 Tax=Halorubrum sp. JWXQ-INN 858 TaxID=2690782 RepID=UPI00135A8EBF|nr:DUF4212 domain-containing protein [Halorubrum sp. JWXQ-INN 858]MWV65743.1 DUF4212 domain-containing protein [Halorubrum sp. JWXQ-INN 858]
MTDNDTHGGSNAAVAGDGGLSDVEREQRIDYLDVEINLLNPATPFMRDHLRVIWIGFAIWSVTTFGPITATRIAPDLMTTPMPFLGFPFHYFAIAIGAPSAALILSVWYAKRRDAIDEKYGIEQLSNQDAGADANSATDDAAAADGGVEE